MRKLLPLALTIGISAIGFAQDTRVIDGKTVQEDKTTINVITPSSSQSMATYSSSGDVKVRMDENGRVIQTDKTTINKVSPAPAEYSSLSNGYVVTPPSSSVQVTTDSHGNIIQTDKTTINKITPAPGHMSTDMMTTTHSGDFQD